jgi:hypothetical protein
LIFGTVKYNSMGINYTLPEISILCGCSINSPLQQENVHVLYEIAIQGNFPIAHHSLWVLEVMFIEKKFEFEEVLHCTYGV